MTRLASALKLDFQLQLRYGFYYAAIFITLVWAVIIRLLPAWSMSAALPVVMFTDLATVGFFFIAGMILFEKGEQTLFAVVVTPLRFWEYLTSKLVTMTVLAIIISMVVVVVAVGLNFNPFLLVLGVSLLSLIALLIGFIAVSPFNSISSFIIPSQIFLIPLGLPLIYYLGWWPHPVFYLIPTQASLLLLKSAFESIATWQLVYAVIYQIAWVVGLIWVARWSFNRFVVEEQGSK